MEFQVVSKQKRALRTTVFYEKEKRKALANKEVDECSPAIPRYMIPGTCAASQF